LPARSASRPPREMTSMMFEPLRDRRQRKTPVSTSMELSVS
jgi:hypothetical protein